MFFFVIYKELNFNKKNNKNSWVHLWCSKNLNFDGICFEHYYNSYNFQCNNFNQKVEYKQVKSYRLSDYYYNRNHNLNCTIKINQSFFQYWYSNVSCNDKNKTLCTIIKIMQILPQELEIYSMEGGNRVN